MTEMKRLLLPFCALTISLGTITRGSEPGTMEAQLTFKERPEAHMGGRITSFGYWHPAYAAGVADNGSRYFVRPGTDFVKYFLNLAERHGISGPQRDFLRATGGGLHEITPNMYLAGGPMADPNDRQLLLYAMSQEDARRMAEAYLLFAREAFDHDVKIQTDNIAQASEEEATARRMVPELHKTIETSRQALEEVRKAVSYRTENEADAVIGDLDKIINAARVDIAGIQAELAAIQDHLRTTRQPFTPAIQSRLEVMFAEESISLHAAEARKREATNLRTQAIQFIELTAALRGATGEKKVQESNLEAAPRRIREAQQELAKLKKEEPRILGNAVFIYPAN